jgi:hypothetical protein
MVGLSVKRVINISEVENGFLFPCMFIAEYMTVCRKEYIVQFSILYGQSSFGFFGFSIYNN